MTRRNIYFMVLTLVLIMAACTSSEELKLNTVRQGEFLASQLETGQLLAVNAKSEPMPFIGLKYGYQQKLIHISDHGQIVKKGDTIAVIDPSKVLRVIREQETKLEIEKANLNKLKARHNRLRSQLKSDLERETANYDLILLQTEKFAYESERKREVKQLELEVAKLNLEKTKKKIALKKVVNAKELDIQKLKILQIENAIENASKTLNLLAIRSPIDGLVQVGENWNTEQQIQAGDELWQGQDMISIPDLSAMKVAASINESDIQKISIGQPVIVRLDAYPDLQFNGEITQIARISRRKNRGSKIKVFDFEVLMEGNNSALKPGMTVSCEIILAQLENTFYVHNSCIIKEGQKYNVYSMVAGVPVATEVKVLGMNNKFTAISGNVKKGMEIVPRRQLVNNENRAQAQNK